MIRPAQSKEIVEGLKLAFHDLDQEAKTQRMTQTLLEYEQNPNLFEGMLVSVDDGTVTGVIWVVRMPGNTSVTGLPVTIDANSIEKQSELLEAANQWIEEQGISLNQFVLAPDQESEWRDSLGKQQHSIAIQLDDMSREIDHPGPDQTDIPEIDLIPCQGRADAEIADVIESTFQASADCPELAHHHDRDEMLAGYRATGDSGDEFWYLLEYEKQHVGCLLLGLRPAIRRAEIVYVGICPSARGKRIGAAALEVAMNVARTQGCREVVAAVDHRNQPALTMYERSGFTPIESRIACVRLISRHDHLT